MSITVSPNLTLISTCDTDEWSLGALDAIVKNQGTNCLGIQAKGVVSTRPLYTFGTPADMTNKHIYVWMMISGVANTIANGGFRIYVETDASNYGTWYVGGKDTHPGGWGCFIIDPASSPTPGADSLGTVNPASIAKIGVQFFPLSTAIGNILNCFWDVCRYGTGLTITSGASDAITFENIFAIDDDSNYKYGVVQRVTGNIYIINGMLTFGGTDAEYIDFVDKNQVVIFPANTYASSTFHGIKVQCGSGTSNFVLGEKSGTAGIAGCLLKSPGTPAFSMDLSDTDNDKIQLYGSTFDNAGTITLLPNVLPSTNIEVLNCNFNACSELIANTCVMTNCNFISADTRAVRIPASGSQITYCNFISCPKGVHFNTTGTYDIYALEFTNCTYDVENSTNGSLITVNCQSGANAAKYINSGGVFETDCAKSYNANTTVFVDETTDINDTDVNDVLLPPIQITTQGDCIYLGDSAIFNGVTINVGTAGHYTNVTITWQYWNGAWTPLTGITDNTNGFKNSGTNTVNFTTPGDWAPYTVKVNRIIFIPDPTIEVSIQEIYNAIRDWEDEWDGIDMASLAEAYGKQSLGGGVYVGITLILINDWRIQFETRSVDTICTIYGGNLLADNQYNNQPIKPSPHISVIIAQSSSAIILEGSGTSPEEVADAVLNELIAEHLDTGSTGKILKDINDLSLAGL